MSPPIVASKYRFHTFWKLDAFNEALYEKCIWSLVQSRWTSTSAQRTHSLSHLQYSLLVHVQCTPIKARHHRLQPLVSSLTFYQDCLKEGDFPPEIACCSSSSWVEADYFDYSCFWIGLLSFARKIGLRTFARIFPQDYSMLSDWTLRACAGCYYFG